jgi:hypothetical protein
VIIANRHIAADRDLEELKRMNHSLFRACFTAANQIFSHQSIHSRYYT